MMNDMKRAMQLLRYGDQFKTYMVMGIIWFAMGVGFVAVCVGEEMAYLAHYQVILPMFMPMFMIQSLASLEAGGMVASSGKRRFLFITAPDLLGLAGMVVMFLVVLVVITIKCILVPDIKELAGGMILCVGLSAAVLQVYMSLVCKYFLGGLAGFLILFNFFYVEAGNMILTSWKPSYGVGLFFGIAVCILGCVAGHFIRVCLYKKPISKFSLGAEMRKYM
ncbi:MAG: hypothetical protein K2L07_10810 [Lachnospiraceae bacterium]|nr:hypothetical protein [Lachnospiraceae bacterium]